jgi:hypothetical protein
LAAGRFHPLPAAAMWGITAALLVLSAGTVILLVTEA